MGGSAPEADPNIGIAALNSSKTGEMMLNWMKDQAKITNNWAEIDRDRYQEKFLPMQDRFIAEAENYASPERKLAEQNRAVADIRLGIRQNRQAADRSAMAMGIDPSSGRARAATDRMATDTALAVAGARNVAGRQVEEQGRSLRANAINLGSGAAVNPATSIGISNGAMLNGGNAAMQGYSQQGNLLNTQYQQQMQAWQANQGAIGSLGGALGAMAGLFLPSSKEIKTDKAPVKSLDAVKKMPVEAWTYKPGEGDEGRHIGPYAEDFKKATGIGDGKSIDVISAIGLSLGAIRDLDAKVDKLAGTKGKSEKVAA